MNPELTTLLEIQDLKAKLKELEESPEIEVEEFNVDLEAARGGLRSKVAELEDGLPDRVQRRYRRIAGNLDRAVVPVINGICYGCFVSIATAVAGEDDPNEQLQTCETCGRFLYILT